MDPGNSLECGQSRIPYALLLCTLPSELSILAQLPLRLLVSSLSALEFLIVVHRCCSRAISLSRPQRLSRIPYLLLLQTPLSGLSPLGPGHVLKVRPVSYSPSPLLAGSVFRAFHFRSIATPVSRIYFCCFQLLHRRFQLLLPDHSFLFAAVHVSYSVFLVAFDHRTSFS